MAIVIFPNTNNKGFTFGATVIETKYAPITANNRPPNIVQNKVMYIFLVLLNI